MLKMVKRLKGQFDADVHVYKFMDATCCNKKPRPNWAYIPRWIIWNIEWQLKKIFSPSSIEEDGEDEKEWWET